ncbi:MAG: pyridoxine 5'-phosphate synthase [Deltaproteobacteria bacterium]|nr:pyridoxine 5'-phosphate synthase [Deltaproteobacteria bacterium]
MNGISQITRRLGVNIDHIATLREARKVSYPAPFDALSILKGCAVDQVTIHLREDRRHIQDHDLAAILKAGVLPVNLEMAVTEEMVRIAASQCPHTATFVPEKREEITTEGGLDCVGLFEKIKQATDVLKSRGIRVSLFVDPDLRQTVASKEAGADAIEFHTGSYCHVIEEFYASSGHYDYTRDKASFARVNTELEKIKTASKKAAALGLKVFAGHGLHTHNLKPVTEISEIEEYNIGHAIIARAVFVGLKQAVCEIQAVLKDQ